LEIKLKNLKSIRVNMFFVILVFFSITNIFAQSPIPAGAKLEKLATGFLQPEGPVWIDGLGILFSDIRGNKIYRWSPVDSTLTPFLNPSDSSNGLTLDLQGRLVLTQMAKRRIAKQELNGTITPLASTYNGKKFNSPNDLVVKSDGSIFFTDPDFNIPVGQSSELKFQGIYRISPSGSITLLDNTLNKPNGICFSLDEKKLYVDESAKDSIYVWDVVNDSVLANKRPFYRIPANGYADGIKVDTANNIYCTGPGGVWIISPTGTGIGKISTSPDNPSNCAWGDADRKTLYITGGSSLYRIRLVSPTDVKKQNSKLPKVLKLNQNYPNPFNPSTTIEYRTNISGSITMKIFDVLGCEIAMLVNEFKHPGTYMVQWNASGMPTGTYFCQLQAGNVVQTKKLVLIR
jgi:gluconolactonase